MAETKKTSAKAEEAAEKGAEESSLVVEATPVVVAAVVQEPSEKTLKVKAQKDHKCRIGSTEVRVAKEGVYEFPVSVVAVLSKAGIVYVIG
jgi:hypothetical protein